MGGNFGSVRDKTSATRTKNQITVTYAKDLEKSCVINIKTRRRIAHALRSEKPEYGIFLLKLNAFVASAVIPFCMEMNGHATKAEAKAATAKAAEERAAAAKAAEAEAKAEAEAYDSM